MTSERYSLRLGDTDVAPGEIGLIDLSAISGRLQELATRVGRWVAEIDRPGRSTSVVEQAVTLRLTAVREGSTVLDVVRGPQGTLDFDTPFEQAVDDRFWQVLAGISEDLPPTDAPPAVRESALELLDSLAHAARSVELTNPFGDRVSFRPAERERSVWATQARTVHDDEVTVSGVVEMVDLKSHKFRLRDDLGNAIPLEGVETTAARLVGGRATVIGRPVHNAKGGLVAIATTSISSASIPNEWVARVEDEAWRTRSSSPDPSGGVDFSDDEWTAFLDAVSGQ